MTNKNKKEEEQREKQSEQYLRWEWIDINFFAVKTNRVNIR